MNPFEGILKFETRSNINKVYFELREEIKKDKYSESGKSIKSKVSRNSSRTLKAVGQGIDNEPIHIKTS